ncbi:MAG: peptidoglycan-binding domain-containing protein, partial [Pseudomonadota bacterium]
PTEPGPPSGCDPGRCSQQITVRQGSQGPCVGLAQQLLAQAGYSPGPVDCVFGSQTNSAVRAFQQARGLAVDGIVGPQTWAALSGAAGDGGQQPEPVPPPPPPPPPVPWLLYGSIGATALLAMLAGYHLVRGSRPEKPEE